MQDATKYYRNGIARFTRRTNCLFTRHLHAYRQSYWGKSYKFTCFFSYIMYICVCVREMSCCFFYALHNTLWITEQHAIETRGLISISQAFWIEIPTKKRDCRFVSAGYYGSFEQGELKWRLYREYRIRFQAIFKMQVLEKKLGKNYAFLPLSCVKPVIYLDGIEWIVECRRALEILINSWIYLVSWTLSPSRNSRDSKFHAINLTFPNH